MINTLVRNFNISRLLYIAKKRWMYVLLFTIIGAAIATVYLEGNSTKMYRAKTSFYLYSNDRYAVESDTYVSSVDFSYAKTLKDSYILILKSETVLEKVCEISGLNCSATALAGKISSSSVDGTSVFYIYVSDVDPYVAMRLANAIAEVAPAEITKIVKSGGISVVDYATLPTSPYSQTNFLKFILLGAGAGFAVPFSLFLFFGLMDTTVRRKEEIKAVFDIPVIGEIPYIQIKKNSGKSKVIDEESPFAIIEAYNSLCTNLLYTTKGEKCPVYVVTSTTQNEGKTLSTVNIAKAFSNLGKKVLVIDADLRNPSVADLCGYDNDSNGLSQYLAGIVNEVEKQHLRERLDVVIAGKCPPNPAELIASERFGKFIEEVKKEYDFIFVDMPPVGVVSDALLIGDYVVGYLLVIRAGVTKMTDEEQIVEEFERTETRIAGFVFNAIDPKAKEYSRKYSHYSYGKK